MKRRMVLFCAVFVCRSLFAQTDANLIGESAWSDVVKYNDHALRGRLLVYDDQGPSASSHARIYLELQHVFQGAWDNPVEVSCDGGAANLRFRLHDANGKEAPQQPSFMSRPWNGPTPIKIPCDATIRVRVDLYSIGPQEKPDGLEFLTMNGTWVVPPKATNDYYLSATLSPLPNDSWRGTLQLPEVKIPHKKPL